MQHLPGSQLFSGHEGVEEWDILAARQKHKNDHQGLSCRGVLGGEGGGLPQLEDAEGCNLYRASKRKHSRLAGHLSAGATDPHIFSS